MRFRALHESLAWRPDAPGVIDVARFTSGLGLAPQLDKTNGKYSANGKANRIRSRGTRNGRAHLGAPGLRSHRGEFSARGRRFRRSHQGQIVAREFKAAAYHYDELRQCLQRED